MRVDGNTPIRNDTEAGNCAIPIGCCTPPMDTFALQSQPVLIEDDGV